MKDSFEDFQEKCLRNVEDGYKPYFYHSLWLGAAMPRDTYGFMVGRNEVEVIRELTIKFQPVRIYAGSKEIADELQEKIGNPFRVDEVNGFYEECVYLMVTAAPRRIPKGRADGPFRRADIPLTPSQLAELNKDQPRMKVPYPLPNPRSVRVDLQPKVRKEQMKFSVLELIAVVVAVAIAVTTIMA